MRVRILLFLLINGMFTGQASAATMRCSGDLKIISLLRSKKAKEEVSFSNQNSFSFTVIDSNQREVIKVWPWSTIQMKPLILPQEMKSRDLQITTNGMSWFAVSVRSTSTGALEKLLCEISEPL